MLNVAADSTCTAARRGAFDHAVVAMPGGAARVRLELAGDRVTAINFLAGDALLCEPVTAAGRAAVDQLRRYFRDPSFQFTVDIVLAGTPFQQRVWRALREIPAGSVRTYGELGRRLGTSPRAIGNACRHNPVPIIVPCHRVIAATGRGGFCGELTGPMIGIKDRLLAHERGC